MKNLRLITYFCLIALLLNTVMPLSAQRPTKTPPTSPPQTTKTQAAKTIPLAFDNLNDFVAKGLPAPAALPVENLDVAAILMARKISKLDDNSLPVLLAALQTAGFTIVDENRKALLKPPGDGKGQGLLFYDWETVGMLKLAKPGVGTTLDKLTAMITKDTLELPASRLSELMLQDLRNGAESDNGFVRFWARLIVALGNSASPPVDLMKASPGSVNLSMLQATLWMRHLTAEIYMVQNLSKKVGQTVQHRGFGTFDGNIDLPRDQASLFSLASYSTKVDDCQLTEAESLMLDAAAFGLGAGRDKFVEYLEEFTHHAGDVAGAKALGNLSKAAFGANLALAWLKLVAALTTMHGELTVEVPLPLPRTTNSTPGKRRLMKARFWSEVGESQKLNCVRLKLVAISGLDFSMPTNGPLAEKAVEWHFAGDNETRVNDAGTRNLDKFVTFESPGKDLNPEDQVTDEEGVSKMYLVGAPKIPPASPNAAEVEKQANVLVGITLKSAKNVKQNLIDIGGTALNMATSGPLALLIAIPEIGFRLPYVEARATIPVTDHEPCDGQWRGTITYTSISTSTSNTTNTYPDDALQKNASASVNTSETATQSGSVIVNGNDGWANESYDIIYTSSRSSHGTTPCCPSAAPCNRKTIGRAPYSSEMLDAKYGSGESQGKLAVNVVLEKDGYRINIKPFSVNATMQSTSQGSGRACIGNHPGSFPSTSFTQSSTGLIGGFNDSITGIGSFGADRNTLSGSSTKTNAITGGKIVTTITWNLRRCN